MLSDEQIERYSRQIILPEVGGRGQERLLGAKLTVVGETEDLVPAIHYLAGAGIGTISLYPYGDDASQGRLAASMRELNSDVRAEVTQRAPMDHVCMILAGSAPVIELACRINQAPGAGSIVFARLDEPYLIALLSPRPPCLRCAHPSLLAAINGPGAFSSVIAMAAVAETIKALLAVAPDNSRLIEFSGYESRSIKAVKTFPGDCPVCG